MWPGWQRGLAFAGGPQEPDPRGGDGGLEVAAVVVLVPDQGLAGPGSQQVRPGGQDAGQHVALVSLGAGQAEGDGQPLQGAHQVQPQAAEVARVAGAVPVFGPSGQVRTLGRLAGPAAFHTPARAGTAFSQLVISTPVNNCSSV